jgi:hypothetical protein
MLIFFVMQRSERASSRPSFCSSLCLLVCLENKQAAIIFLQLSFVFLFVLQTYQNCFMEMQKASICRLQQAKRFVIVVVGKIQGSQDSESLQTNPTI